MKRLTHFLLMMLALLWIMETEAAQNFQFTISSGHTEDIEWCVEHKIGRTVWKELNVNSSNEKLKDWITFIETELKPHGIVPHQKLYLGIGSDTPYSREDVLTYINNPENVDKTITWLRYLSQLLNDLYDDVNNKEFRFRLYNEVNTYGIIEPDAYYLIVEWFYPLFKRYGPEGGSLVLSYAGGENEHAANGFPNQLRGFLAQHRDSSRPLPIDGIDIHGGKTYDYWKHAYQKTKTIFDEILGDNGSARFKEMSFWSLETCRSTHGMASFDWGHNISEYNSDWDVVRESIKNVTSTLSIPNMMFTAIYEGRSEYEKRYGCLLFDMMGFKDHGCHTFDKGTDTPINGVEGIQQFTNYINGYYPDTPYDQIFSISNVKNHRFQTQDGKFRVIVWRDHGNTDTENQIVYVPFSQYNFVHKLDFVTGQTQLVPVYSDQTGTWVELTLNENPQLLTPSLETGGLSSRYLVHNIRSGLSNLSSYPPGEWESTLHLYNPSSGLASVEILAFDSSGSPVGSPYELTLISSGAQSIEIENAFPAFSGFLTLSASQNIIGQIEHQLKSDTECKGVLSTISCVNAEAVDLLANQKFLSMDWEVDSGLKNTLNLVNTSDESAQTLITLLDESGQQQEQLSFSIDGMCQMTIPILENASDHRFGQVLVESPHCIYGQLNRHSPDLWIEEDLFDDSHLLTEIELKDCEISDSESYSRIIVSNPWVTSVSGSIFAKNVDDITLSETRITLAGGETMELSIENPATSTLLLKLDNDVKVFGRIEDVQVIEAGNQLIASKTIDSERIQPGKFILPWFIHVRNENSICETFLNLENKTKNELMAQIFIYDSQGLLVSKCIQAVAEQSKATMSVSDMIPSEIVNIEGSVQIRIPHVEGFSAHADYEINNNSDSQTLRMNSKLHEFH